MKRRKSSAASIGYKRNKPYSDKRKLSTSSSSSSRSNAKNARTEKSSDFSTQLSDYKLAHMFKEYLGKFKNGGRRKSRKSRKRSKSKMSRRKRKSKH